MKSFGLHLLTLALLVMLVSCGKDNESGKSAYSNPYYNNMYGNINSPYAYNNGMYSASLNQVMNENPCIYGTGRVQLQQQLTTFQGILQPNEIYVGVSYYGHVAALIGQGGQPPLLVSYLCQTGNYGSNYMNGTPQLTDLALGATSRCVFKQLTRATLYVPGSPAPIYFGRLEDGSSRNMQPFSFCR